VNDRPHLPERDEGGDPACWAHLFEDVFAPPDDQEQAEDDLN